MEEILPDGDVIEIVISRPDKGYMRCFDPLNKTYRQIKLPGKLDRVFNPDALYEWTEDGFKTIDKRKCRRFIGRLRSAMDSAAYVACFVDVRTGMHRRRVGYDEKGDPGVAIDYLKAKVGPPPREVFEMPKGYKRGYWK
jgi:hypothetical protein